MKAKIMLGAKGLYLFYFFKIIAAAAAAVAGVFEAHQAGMRLMRIIGIDRLLHLGSREKTAIAV